MTRWEPDARRRLTDAAMELFAEHGYPATTTAAIAARAGLTERTLYRYFPDKQEVLFGDEARLQELLVDTVDATLADVGPAGALRAALRALAADLQPRHRQARRRAQIIFAHPELAGRESAKVSAWTAAVADCLGSRGGQQDEAWLAAELAVAIFRAAYRCWVTGPARSDLPAIVDQMMVAARPLLDEISSAPR